MFTHGVHLQLHWDRIKEVNLHDDTYDYEGRQQDKKRDPTDGYIDSLNTFLMSEGVMLCKKNKVLC